MEDLHLSFLSIAFPNLLNINARMIMNLIINRWKKKEEKKYLQFIFLFLFKCFFFFFLRRFPEKHSVLPPPPKNQLNAFIQVFFLPMPALRRKKKNA